MLSQKRGNLTHLPPLCGLEGLSLNFLTCSPFFLSYCNEEVYVTVKYFLLGGPKSYTMLVRPKDCFDQCLLNFKMFQDG